MKYNMRNVNHRQMIRTSALSISASGSVFFNRRALEMLHTDPEDVAVEFYHDQVEKQWYVRHTHVDGLKIREQSGRYLFQNKYLATKLIESMGLSPEEVLTAKVPLADQPTLIEGVKWYALITRNALIRSKS